MPSGAKPGSLHPNWKGDSISEKGGRGRAQRLYPVVKPCERCGKKKAERHHRDNNTANNEPSNIHFLCRRCHMEIDGRLERFRQVAKRPGPRGGHSRFGTGDLDRMRAMLAAGQSQRSIGIEFHVTQTCVSRLLAGKRKLSDAR